MKLFTQTLAGMALTAFASTSLYANTLSEECQAMGGEVVGSTCVVVTVDTAPFSEIIRDAGKSGLGWTAAGNIVTTTTEIFEIVESVSAESAFIAGNPNLPGCQSSKNQPKKCNDHWTDAGEVTQEWELFFTDSTDEKIITACYNPGGRNMGMHKHCAI
jgi:hypothetical protein